jgi:hypothetical protein
MADLIANTALSAVPVKNRHVYAEWSAELLQAFTDERHVAVYPNGDPEVVHGATVGSLPSDDVLSSYTIVVWEEAASEATRLYDDDVANAAWLALYEAIRARLYVQANVSLGQTNSYTRYQGGAFGMKGAVRWMELRFTVGSYLSFT